MVVVGVVAAVLVGLESRHRRLSASDVAGVWTVVTVFPTNASEISAAHNPPSLQSPTQTVFPSSQYNSSSNQQCAHVHALLSCVPRDLRDMHNLRQCRSFQHTDWPS
ncbi:unnamed protein product [Mesocestoides corti]|nr:unnamed protein product [Mesocestoides corti]